MSTTAAGPRPRPFIGHLLEFRADRLAFLRECARAYGDVVPLRLPGRSILLFNHPDLIEQVLVTQSRHFVKHFGLRVYKPVLGNGLVTSEGDFWRRQRKLSAPAFQGARLAGYARDMVASTTEMLRGWQTDALRAADPRAPVRRDIHGDMMRLTLTVACRTLFGADACPDPHAVGDAMEQALRALDARFGRPFPFPDWVPTPGNLRLRRALRTLDGVVGGIIARRRQSAAADPGAADGHDLLSTLIRARDEDDGSAMTDAQLLDEARTIFLAGHETTALALTYAIHLLATHPDAQAALAGELATALGGRPPAYEDLTRLPYARRVVTEAMRLYPPADVLGREAVADCTVDGVPVPRGTTVFMSQWVMHHDPRYFPDPDRFDPGRWTPEFERALPRFAYFPFGGGPRFCIGQSFALAEAALILATLCQRFRFAPVPGFRLELWPSITLRPRGAVPLLVSARGPAC
jgi:cytochrome P450